MKASFSLLAAALVASTTANRIMVDFTPLLEDAESDVSAAVETTYNEYVDGGCRDVIIFFARGTTEPGNVGDSPGPQTIDLLKAALGEDVVAGQGIDYSASLLGNLYEGGCPPDEAADMAALITDAATSCPSAQLLVSGYSQGAAMVHRSIEQLSASVRGQIAAAVTYGDTQNQQDGAQIPNYPVAKTLIICHDGDLVCDGTLIITGEHSGYEEQAPQAVEFMTGLL